MKGEHWQKLDEQLGDYISPGGQVGVWQPAGLQLLRLFNGRRMWCDKMPAL